MALLYIRSEVDVSERRVPLTPEAAGQLRRLGHEVFVESSNSRIFPDDSFLREGCVIAKKDGWRGLSRDAIVLGMKSLPRGIRDLRQTHVYFAHAYDRSRLFDEKNGVVDLLQAFKVGGGQHFDFELLLNDKGARLVAAGSDAGRVATCISLLQWAASKSNPSIIDFATLIGTPYSLLEERAMRAASTFTSNPRCVVIGASGRCGAATTEVLQKAGLSCDRWSRAETSRPDCGQRLGDFDIIYNCCSAPSSVPQFLTEQDVFCARRLAMLVDIGCEQSGNNPLQLYGATTKIDRPFKRIERPLNPLLVMAVDNLPSFTAVESSINFSRQLSPLLEMLLDSGTTNQPWCYAGKIFSERMRELFDRLQA